MKPGHCLSRRRHFYRNEHWVMVRGTAEVTSDGQVVFRHENESYLPIGSVHRLANPDQIDLDIIEVQVAATRARTTSSASTTSTGGAGMATRRSIWDRAEPDSFRAVNLDKN